MKITYAEALSISKGLTLTSERMEEITTFVAKDGKNMMTLGRHGVYFALGDKLAKSYLDEEGIDISDLRESITPEAAFAALDVHLKTPKKKGKLTLLNTAILTAAGTFTYTPISLDEAKQRVSSSEISSAIGHQVTADIMTELLGVSVMMNRVQYVSQPGDTCLVFKVNGRPPEGVILTREEVEKIGYSFFLLTHN